MLTEDVEDFFRIAPLLATGVEFAVAVGSCASLAKAVVGLRVDLLLAAYQGQITLAVAHILSTFHDHRPQAQLNQAKGGKETTRPSTHNDDLWFSLHREIVGGLILRLLWHLIDIHT